MRLPLRSPVTPVHADDTPLPVFEHEEPSLVQHETILEEPSLVQHAIAPEEPSLVQHDSVVAEAAEIEAPEFEPSEASASYRFDPTTPSAYRQSSVAEPPAPEAEPATESFSHDAIAEPTPEASSQPEPFFGEAASIVQPTHSHPSEEASTQTEIAPATRKKSPSSAKTTLLIWKKSRWTSKPLPIMMIASSIPALAISKKKPSTKKKRKPMPRRVRRMKREYDDLVEETLDVQMDSGMLSEFVRDQHIEQRTRFDDENGDASADGSEVEEDYSEDEAFAAEMGEIELEDGSDSADEAEESQRACECRCRPQSSGRRSQWSPRKSRTTASCRWSR